MAWPTTKATTDHLDNQTDDPNLARVDIKRNVENVNSIIDFFTTTSLANDDILQYDSANGYFKNVSVANSGLENSVLLTFVSNAGRNTNYYRFSEVSDPYGLATITTGAVGLDGKLNLATGTYLIECGFMEDGGNYDSNPFFTTGASVAVAITHKIGGTSSIGTNNEVYQIPLQKFVVSSASQDYYIQFDSSSTNDPFNNSTDVIVKLTKIS